MSEAIIVALITGLCAVAGNFLVSLRSSRDFYARLDKAQAVTDTKLEALAREVREHNNFARRLPVVEEQLTGIDRRLGFLERKGGSA